MCGTHTGTFPHTTWECKHLQAIRNHDPDIRKLKVLYKSLPHILTYAGWAPALSADPTLPFWGNDKPGCDEPLPIVEHGVLSTAFLGRNWPRVAEAKRNGAFDDYNYACEFAQALRGDTWARLQHMYMTPIHEDAPATPNGLPTDP